MSKLFVYGVSGDCPKEVLASAFGSCGKVDDVYNWRFYNTGCVWFVTMADEAGADKAVYLATLPRLTVAAQQGHWL